jgi:hypothetical protein
MLDGIQSQSGHSSEEKKSPLPEIKTWFFGHPV